FAVTAVATLGLGIGLSTAVFTVADALLVRRLPVRDQDRIVALWGETRDRSFSNYPVAGARDFARRTGTLERVAFFGYWGSAPMAVRTGGNITDLRRALVSGVFFDVLGTRPVLGRALRAEDDVFGARPVVVISYGAWQRLFSGDTTVLGRQILLHAAGVTYTIVGVMPRGLDYPRGTELWAPLVPATTKSATDSSAVEVDVVARLRPGFTAVNARDELTAFFTRPEASRFEKDLHGVVQTLPQLILGDTRPAVLAFAASVALL